MKILTQRLKEKHRRAGLELEEDGHILYLKKGKEIITGFSATVIEIGTVLAVADAYLKGVNND